MPPKRNLRKQIKTGDEETEKRETEEMDGKPKKNARGIKKPSKDAETKSGPKTRGDKKTPISTPQSKTSKKAPKTIQKAAHQTADDNLKAMDLVTKEPFKTPKRKLPLKVTWGEEGQSTTLKKRLKLNDQSHTKDRKKAAHQTADDNLEEPKGKSGSKYPKKSNPKTPEGKAHKMPPKRNLRKQIKTGDEETDKRETEEMDGKPKKNARVIKKPSKDAETKSGPKTRGDKKTPISTPQSKTSKKAPKTILKAAHQTADDNLKAMDLVTKEPFKTPKRKLPLKVTWGEEGQSTTLKKRLKLNDQSHTKDRKKAAHQTADDNLEEPKGKSGSKYPKKSSPKTPKGKMSGPATPKSYPKTSKGKSVPKSRGEKLSLSLSSKKRFDIDDQSQVAELQRSCRRGPPRKCRMNKTVC